jgi:hypothetical protein
MSLGREDRIFCIVPDSAPKLIDGKDAVFQCFPPALTEKEELPLAADARPGKDGFHNARLKLVAGLIGANAGALEDRDRARRRNRAILAGAAAFIAVAGPAAATWAYVLPQESYAKSYVRVFGRPSPVDVLTPAMARSREKSFRFVRNGYFGDIHRVESINGSGACNASSQITSLTGDAFSFNCNNARACAIEVASAGGEVKGEKILDQFDEVLEEISYQQDDGDQAIRKEAIVGCSRLDNGIKFIGILRGKAGADRGRDMELRFFREPTQARANGQYAYGYRYVYDSVGRTVSTKSLGKAFTPSRGKAGWAHQELVFDLVGNIVEYRWLDEAGKLVTTQAGFARQTVEWDAAGNPVLVRNFLPNGRPAIDTDGNHALRARFDARGNRERVDYLDSALLPVTIASGYRRAEQTFDERGYRLSTQRFGADDNPAPDNQGCVRYQDIRTPTGEQTSSSCWDAEGKPALTKEGVHETRYEQDDRGNLTAESYFDGSGAPALRRNVHRIVYKWDTNKRRRIGTTHFDQFGKATTTDTGFHGYRTVHDGNGFIIREEFIDANGALTRDSKGAFAYRFENDDRGGLLRQTPLGPDGEVLDLAETHFAYERDEFGRKVRQWYLDVAGKRGAGKAGIAGWSTEYDVYGRVRRETNLDAVGQPTKGSDSVSEDREYDERGFPVRTLYRDAGGNLTPGGTNGSIIQRDYDVRGHVTAYRTLGADGKPVLRSEGYSTVAVVVDMHGRPIETRHLGLSNEPVLTKGNVHGWSQQYDTRGNRIELLYRDVNWAPKARADDGEAAIYRYTYDAQNRQSSVRYFGVDGSPQPLPYQGYGKSYERDARGDIVRELNLGADGKPAPQPNGIAITAQRRDALGRVVQYDYLDASGAPLQNDRARALVKFDRFGNILEQRFTDALGALRISNGSGRAVLRREYDTAGRQLSEVSLDASEQPVDRTDEGWHRKDMTYTPGGALIKEVCTTTAGKEVAC